MINPFKMTKKRIKAISDGDFIITEIFISVGIKCIKDGLVRSYP